MRTSLKWLMHGSCSAIAAASVAVGGVHASDIAVSRDLNSNVVGSLSVMGDLEPVINLASLEQSSTAPVAIASPAFRAGFQTRSSVPAVDRSQSYASHELFANSKSVVPLLVSDIEPAMVSVVRPMSGRSVGARPSLPWSKRGNASASK
jgi:hypothetical protein